MTSESRKWESLKAEYLHKVEKALSSVKHARGKEVLEDVRSHLDRRFAELEPEDQTWENFQTIITQMGPASDYAELLDARASSSGPAIGLKHLWWVGLAAVIIIAAILLPKARPARTAGYIVKFTPVGQFKPVTARQLLDAFNETHPRGVRTHHFRTQVNDDSLTGYICVDTEAAKNAIVSMLEKSEKLTLIKATAATSRELKELYKMGQPSISSAVPKDNRLPTARPAGTAGYIVKFKPVGQFKPVTARQLLDAFNANHPRGVRTHHFRTQVKDDNLTGYICVDTEAAKDAVASMLEKSEKLTLIKATAATSRELEELYKMGQPSISSAVPKDYRPLAESANRKLLDQQTLKQLRSHEEFSAGWFKVEEAYTAASNSEKSKMVQRWMADATSDDFEKVQRAIAALGNVAAKQALDVLMGIGQKPKKGNRPRWMAVRALGRIGDKKAVPLLVNLLDHYNTDTRLYAKVALCEITGVFFGDSKQKWTEWANSQGIEVKQMDVGPKAGDNNRTRRTPRSRLRPPSSRNQRVSQSGSWPDGDCSIYGRIYRKGARMGIGHGKVSLSSEEFGSWVVEAEEHGGFGFRYIPAGIYTLRTLETFGYQDACYNPEDKIVEEPTFRLKEGERKSLEIEVEPVRPYHRISGRILDEDGKPITDYEGLIVYARWQKTQGPRKGQYQRISMSSVNEDGGYLLEGLDARPVYVRVHDREAPNKDNPYPPRFYPGTFSRADAKLVTSEGEEIIENVDIPLKRTGGLVLEGVVTDESTGAPVPESLVSVHHHDMTFDLFCGYTDKQGRYRIEGLGEGRFMVHVDAVHKGLIKTRKTVIIEPDSAKTHLDITLRRGVTVTGRLVDQNGDPWKVGRGYGSSRAKRQDSQDGGGSTLVYGNKYAPIYIREGRTAFYMDGQGDILGVRMVFPTESSFMLPAMVPGESVIKFSPEREGKRLVKILYQGRDILQTGLVAEPGRNIEDVTLVIGTSGANNRTQRSRLRPPKSRNKTVRRSGSWPDGDCSIYGSVYRRASWSRIGHGKVCLSSEQFGSWVVEIEFNGSFDFAHIPTGAYTLNNLETFGYQDTYYNPEGSRSEKPTFQLREGERESANIEIKPSRPYRRIAGRVLGEDGKPITDSEGLRVFAWVQQPQGHWKGHYSWFSSAAVGEDSRYLIDELDGRPVYVQVRDRAAPKKDNPYPPRFYPGTFSRAGAKLVTFGDDDVVENIDIPMMKTGGLVLKGQVTNESTGEPLPETLVSIFHFDMFHDLFYAYTDDQGRYEIAGLGEGKFIVHVDAVHKGLVKTRKIVTIEADTKETQLDFTMRRGVAIGGRFVDQDGKPWQVGRNFGNGRSGGSGFGGPASNFPYGNRYAPAYIRNGCTVFYGDGEGDGLGVVMVFPTESSFLLSAMVPGETVIDFRPRGTGERLLKILYQGRDVSRDGFVTEPGQKIDDVTIVIGTSGGGGSGRAQTGDRLEFALYDAFGRQVRSQDYKGVPIFLEFGACW